MAKSKETNNKREQEKKRSKQKEDKRQRNEERKANKKKGESLEDMMAYVDEDGNLSSKPPDPRNKRQINAEDIQVGVPKHEEKEEVLRTGIVQYYDTSKGFGFINDLQTNERVFFHVNNLTEEVKESNKVGFMVEKGPRGLNAIQVRKIS